MVPGGGPYRSWYGPGRGEGGREIGPPDFLTRVQYYTSLDYIVSRDFRFFAFSERYLDKILPTVRYVIADTKNFISCQTPQFESVIIDDTDNPSPSKSMASMTLMSGPWVPATVADPSHTIIAVMPCEIAVSWVVLMTQYYFASHMLERDFFVCSALHHITSRYHVPHQ